jgi:hypothetical protein
MPKKQKYQITVESCGRTFSKVSTAPYACAVCAVGHGTPQHWSTSRENADALARERFRSTCEKVVLETVVTPI